MCARIMLVHFTGEYYTNQNNETWKYLVDQVCGADGHCILSPVGVRNKCLQKPPWGTEQCGKRSEWVDGLMADIIDLGWPDAYLQILLEDSLGWT